MSELHSYDAAQLMQLLPYKHPFVMLDAVTDVDPGNEGVGWKNIAASDPIFAGHFPGRPIYPGAMLIEATAQTAAVCLADPSDGELTAIIGYLATIKKFRFQKIVVPGDKLRIHVKAKTKFGALVDTECSLSVDNTIVASGMMALAYPGDGA